MADRLQNKIALVTGAGTGIGRAIALAMFREGARVSLVGRRKPLLKAVANQIGNQCVVFEADISQRPGVDRAIERTVSHFGGITTLVNNAGVLHIGTADQITEEQWDETFDINVRGLWQLSKAALPHLRQAGGGSIINVASVLG